MRARDCGSIDPCSRPVRQRRRARSIDNAGKLASGGAVPVAGVGRIYCDGMSLIAPASAVAARSTPQVPCLITATCCRRSTAPSCAAARRSARRRGPAALSRDHHRQLGDQQVRREHRPDPRCLALEVAAAELVTEHSAQRVHGRAGDAGAERSTAALGEQLLGDVQHERRGRAPSPPPEPRASPGRGPATRPVAPRSGAARGAGPSHRHRSGASRARLRARQRRDPLRLAAVPLHLAAFRCAPLRFRHRLPT